MSKNGLPYYKRFPRDFVEGTIGMPYAIKGVYGILLDLIYLHGGRCPDDAAYISTMCGCSKRLWRVARDELIRLEKIIEVDGFLSNERAEIELKSLRKFAEKQMEIARNPRPSRVKSKTSASQNLTNQNQIYNSAVQTTSSQHSRATPIDLSARLCAALGVTDETKSPGLLSLSDPLYWINSGCDLELDILPVLQSRRGAKVRAWGYFTEPVFEARDRRLAAPRPVENSTTALAPRNGSGVGRQPRKGRATIALEMAARFAREANGVEDDPDTTR